MNKENKTNSELIKELEQLRRENNLLKALTDKQKSEGASLNDSVHEKKLAMAMQGGKMAWWEMDIATGIVTFDPQKVEMLGYAPENFKHYTDFTVLLHPDDYERAMNAMKKHMEGVLDKYEVEYRILTKSGEYVWFYDYGSIIKDHFNGSRLICTGFVYNITERKQAEEVLYKNEQMLQTVMDNFPGVIFWKDLESRYLGCNQAFAAGAGFNNPAEIVGKTVWDLPWGQTEKENYMADDLHVMQSGKSINHIIEKLHHMNDRVIWLDTSKIPLRDSEGRVIGVIGVSTDISQLKLIEHELVKANKELVEQNKQKEKQAGALEVALEKAEESDRLKSEFLSNMSHEIRTPINSILGFTELLKDPDLSSWKQKEFLLIIEKSVGRMLNIIDDIVDYSRIEAGQMKINISTTNINKELDLIYDFYAPEADYKGIKIIIDNFLPTNEATLNTDRDKFYAILSNLVKNAIKFTRSGSIEIGYEKMDNCMEFFVKDTGIGVTEEQKEIIFRRFRQGSESENKKYEGTGLGLSISKAYVEALGGKIWVESGPGSDLEKGAAFYFTLPLNNENEKQMPEIRLTESNLKSE